jgi:hypothetical protein
MDGHAGAIIITTAVARSLVLTDLDSLDASGLSRLSRASLDAPLRGDAELTCARVTSGATLLGAFQRGAGFPADATLVRRASGGVAVRVEAGTLYVRLCLARVDALVACDPPRILNRYVRPILRALTKCGAMASYGGRDFIRAANSQMPIAFAHEASTQRTAVEAFLSLDDARLERAIEEAFASAYDATFERAPPHYASDDDDPRADPPWSAVVHEAIGDVCAGRDRNGAVRVGGDFMASRDAVARLEARIASGDDLDASIDESLGPRDGGVALFGVRSLASFKSAIERAVA